jgi:RsiW-degrading membrane proteinase PrsW (M82 family)
MQFICLSLAGIGLMRDAHRMTQPDLRTIAQQGNLNAIALWLNRTLHPRGVTVKVRIKAGVLKILLTAHRPLEQQAYVQLLQQQIRELDLPHLDRLKIYCQHSEQNRPTWVAEVFLASEQAESKALVPASLNEEVELAPVEISRPERAEASRPRQKFPLAVLLPYRDVFRPGLYRSAIGRRLLFLALVPLLINLLTEQVSLAQTAWFTGIYYAIVWSLLLYHLIKPTQVSWIHAIGCVLFTVFISIPLLLLVQRVPPFNALYQATGQPLPSRLIGFVLGVGVLEEVCKAIPLFSLMRRDRKRNDLHTVAFYGAMSGLGFAVAESGAYSVQYAIGLTRGQIDLGMYLAANTIRFVSLPLFHAVLTGIVGFFIGLAIHSPGRRFALLIMGLAIAAVLHGLYNAVSGGFPGLCIIGFSIALFIAYLDRSPQMVQHLEDEQAHSQKNSR